MARIIRKLATKPTSVRTGTVKRKITKPASGAKDTAAPKKKTSGFDRGSDGFAKARGKREAQEEQYQRQKDTPFSFWLAPGSEAEVVILDKGDPFFVSMHKIKAANGKWVDEVCIADTGVACPLCESTGKEGSFCMVLTVLDRRPYTVKKGPNAGKTIKISKKLAYVKGRNMPKFQRQFEGPAKGNFRGMKMLCHRAGDKESAMGEDIEFRGRIADADTFLGKFKENGQAADYTKIFEMPSAAELRKRYNLGAKGAVAGQEEFSDEEFEEGSVGWGDD